MADDTDALLDATTALIPPLLQGLEALAHAGRQLNPPDLPVLAQKVAAFHAPMADGLARFAAVRWPEHLQTFSHHAAESARLAGEGCAALAGCLAHSNPVLAAYRALGLHSQAVEMLYPVAFMLPPVNRFFLSPGRRGDEALQARLLNADPARQDTGVMHAGNAAEERGGFSLYVPEYQSAEEPAPLVVALHGGSGHGRRFLWTWLREARSYGALVIAPTARADTWSLMGPDVDSENLLAMLDYVRGRWPVDERRLLLTGMSDGGTFSYVSGLQDDSPFTHLAPVSASFHPMLLEAASAERLRGLPVYLVHGGLDWMFPVDIARMARTALSAAGASVVYRELDDLSHTYPVEENARILDWLTDTATAGP